MPALTPYLRRVHYYETDQMGIVHHANDIHWFEEARVDMMDQLGFPYRRLEAEGIASPLLGITADYKSMVRFDDRLRITVTVAALTASRLTLRYRVEDAETGLLRTTGETRHCFSGPNGRPLSLKKHCPELYERLAALLQETEETEA